ncbi:MAG: CoA transferase [Dehalococcoidia bacterium]
MAGSALDDIRVLDFSQRLCGPYATKLLADFGADVLKVERPGVGDAARRLGPFKDDDRSLEGGIFAYLNATSARSPST